MKIPDGHQAVIAELVARLPLAEVNWALTGSTAHALQGVPVEAHDVDIQTDERGAWQVAERFTDAVTTMPVRWSEAARIRSFFGRFVLHGIEVEIMGAASTRDAGGQWLPPTDPAHHRLLVPMGELLVPVLDLGYEAAAYDRLGRPDRAALLRRFDPSL